MLTSVWDNQPFFWLDRIGDPLQTTYRMKKRKNSIPIVIDLVNCEQPTRPRAIKTPSIIDLTNWEPDVIAVNSITPQTRARKRKLTETLSRSSSVSENEVMVLGSNFPLKKKKKKTGSQTPAASTKPAIDSSKKTRKESPVKKRKSHKKLTAKSKSKLADISNVAVNRSKQASFGSPPPLSKAANDYYSKITRALLNGNTSNVVSRQVEPKSKTPNKQETITRTLSNGVATASFKPTFRPAVTRAFFPQLRAGSPRIPLPPHQIIRNSMKLSNLRSSPRLPLTAQSKFNRSQNRKSPLSRNVGRNMSPLSRNAGQNMSPLSRNAVRNRSLLSRNAGRNTANSYHNVVRNNIAECSGRREGGKLQNRLRQENFKNFHNPNPISVEEEGFRPIVIDGCNVACGHGRGRFSPKGIQICVDFFNKRGLKRVKVFMPQSNQKLLPQEIVDSLHGKCEFVFTPAPEVNGVVHACYDDRFIVQYANEVGGIIVSTDNYRDLLQENPSWKHVIQSRLLMFTWVDDVIMFPQDPLGKHGPTLQEFLKF